LTVSTENGNNDARHYKPGRDLTFDVVNLLVANPDVDKSDEFECWDAAAWTIRMNPGKDDAQELAYAAFAKYLELVARD
jgi:hypothetical protein